MTKKIDDKNERYTKKIKCPQCGDEAILYTWGHECAGIWVCRKTSISGSCEHEETEIETATSNYMNANGVQETEHEIYVCAACRCALEGDPLEDRLESIESARTDAFIEERALNER